MKQDIASIEVTEHLVVIRREGISRPIIANVLGMDRHDDGSPKRVFLDRLVHRHDEEIMGGWRVSGAISTIMDAP